MRLGAMLTIPHFDPKAHLMSARALLRPLTLLALVGLTGTLGACAYMPQLKSLQDGGKFAVFRQGDGDVTVSRQFFEKFKWIIQM